MNKAHKLKIDGLQLSFPQTPTVIDAEKLQAMYAELSPSGQELFEISLGIPEEPEQLQTTEEIRAEIARRRGNFIE